MSFPPSILERATDHKLGEPVRASDGRASLRRALVWTGLLGFAGVALIPTALAGLATGHTVTVMTAAVLAIVLVVVAWLVRRSGLLVGPAGLRVRNKAVYLFTGGLVLDAKEEQVACAWDDLISVTVSGVRESAQSPTRYRFCVVTADGREIALGPELSGVREIGERVAAEVTGRVLPDLLARVRADEPVRMGPFTLGADGVEKEGERIAWTDVVDAGVDNGVVFVGTREETRRLSAIASRVPNAIAFAEACRTLADDLAGDQDSVPHG